MRSRRSSSRNLSPRTEDRGPKEGLTGAAPPSCSPQERAPEPVGPGVLRHPRKFLVGSAVGVHWLLIAKVTPDGVGERHSRSTVLARSVAGSCSGSVRAAP